MHTHEYSTKLPSPPPLHPFTHHHDSDLTHTMRAPGRPFWWAAAHLYPATQAAHTHTRCHIHNISVRHMLPARYICSVMLQAICIYAYSNVWIYRTQYIYHVCAENRTIMHSHSHSSMSYIFVYICFKNMICAPSTIYMLITTPSNMYICLQQLLDLQNTIYMTRI